MMRTFHLKMVIVLCLMALSHESHAQSPTSSIDLIGIQAEDEMDAILSSRRPDQFTRPGAYDAQLVIDACWATNRERYHTKELKKIQDAFENIVTCLEKTVAERLPSIIPADKLQAGKVPLIFDELRTPFQVLYYYILNYNKGCDHCSKANEVTYMFPYARYLEDLIRETEYARATYNLTPIPVPKK